MPRREVPVTVTKIVPFCDLHEELGESTEGIDEDVVLRVASVTHAEDHVLKGMILCSGCRDVYEGSKEFWTALIAMVRERLDLAEPPEPELVAAPAPIPLVPAKVSPEASAGEPVIVEPARALADVLPDTVICPLCRSTDKPILSLMDNHARKEHGRGWRKIAWCALSPDSVPTALTAGQLKLLRDATGASAVEAEEDPWTCDPFAVQCPMTECRQKLSQDQVELHVQDMHRGLKSSQIEWKFLHTEEDRELLCCNLPECGEMVYRLNAPAHARGHGRKLSEMRWKKASAAAMLAEQKRRNPASARKNQLHKQRRNLPPDMVDPTLRHQEALVLCKFPGCANPNPMKAGGRGTHARRHGKSLEEVTFVLADNQSVEYTSMERAIDEYLAGTGVKDITGYKHRDRNRIKHATVFCPVPSCRKKHVEIPFQDRMHHAQDAHGIKSARDVHWIIGKDWPEKPEVCGICKSMWPTLSSLVAHDRWFREHPQEAVTHSPNMGSMVLTANRFDAQGMIIPTAELVFKPVSEPEPEPVLALPAKGEVPKVPFEDYDRTSPPF